MTTSTAPPRLRASTQCYGCSGVYAAEKLRLHVSQQLQRGGHPRPPPAWLAHNALSLCDSHRHPAWVFPSGRSCRRCATARDSSPSPSSSSSSDGGGDDDSCDVPADTSTCLADWLTGAAALRLVEAAVEAHRDRPARRFLPGGAAARQFAATIVTETAVAAHQGHPAAQALLTYLPRILFSRGRTIASQLDDLKAGVIPDAHAPSRTVDPMTVRIERLSAAVVCGDLRSINRLLEDDGGPAITPAARHAVLEEKFPYKPDGELSGGPAAEAAWIDKWRARCGGSYKPLLSQRELLRWARSRRDKAADAGGWSGRLILELHSTDPAASKALAAAWDGSPTWSHRGAAAAAWRLLRGSLIPKHPLPRPIATASVPRRAWGGAALARVRAAANAFCLKRNQFGLSDAGGQAAYVLGAKVVLGLGGDLAVDDKTNSYHELHRSAIFRGAGAFLHSLDPEERARSGRLLVEILARAVAGPPALDASASLPSTSHHALPRSVYRLGADASRTLHALAQGSTESSLLEALTYASSDYRPLSRAFRATFHDDGYLAALPSLSADVFRRPPASDGSRVAESKDKVVGPRALDIAAKGFARHHVSSLLIAGVPVGELEDGLRLVNQRFLRKVAALRRIGEVDPVLAVSAAFAVGGPAGLFNHIMRTTHPCPVFRRFLADADDIWVELILDLLDIPPPLRTTRTKSVVAGRIPGLAAPLAGRRYAEGVRDAAPHLAALLATAGIPFDGAVWAALGLGEWVHGGRTHWRDLVACASQRIPPPSRDGPAPPNLWLTWLRSPAGGHARQRRRGLIALRLAFDLPLTGHSTGIAPPRSCMRCGAPAIRTEGARARGAGPRSRVDAFGRHALTCAMSGGDTQRRHNAVAAAVRDCANDAGWRATTHSGPVFAAHRGRPADVWIVGRARFPAGLAIDVTIVAGRGSAASSAALAERRKCRKYGREVEATPGLGFAPFAIDLRGVPGPAACALLQDMARAAASRADSSLSFSEAYTLLTSAIARAFVEGCVGHCIGFENRQRRPSPPPPPARAHGARPPTHSSVPGPADAPPMARGAPRRPLTRPSHPRSPSPGSDAPDSDSTTSSTSSSASASRSASSDPSHSSQTSSTNSDTSSSESTNSSHPPTTVGHPSSSASFHSPIGSRSAPAKRRSAPRAAPRMGTRKKK